jgi:tryptophan halogenase
MNPIKNIVILGGGTSAWLAAAYISKTCPYFKITVVDKEIGSPIGVGEGSLISFKPFMDTCGFEFKEWFPQVDATYKTGILFKNWTSPGYDIWHGFALDIDVDEKYSLADVWSRNQQLSFKEHGMALYDTAVTNNKVDPSISTYAYHVDCGKLVTYIQEKIKNRIQIIRSEMVSINRRNSDNYISSIILKDGQEIFADVFIDCTGFKGLLNHNPTRIDITDRVICDTALACPVQYLDKEKEQRPYTISEAVEHGWCWTIPTQSRMGSGLVFNKKITDIETAKDFFVKYWQGRIDRNKIRVIDWTPYYNENSWHENVVAIGLSAGFLEPLEATGIALIMEGIVEFVRRTGDMNYTDNDVNLYNNSMKSFFEEAIDFVSMHYTNVSSTLASKSKFWNVVQNTIKITNKHQFYINYLNDPTIPMPRRGKDTSFFTGLNWNCMLSQMGFNVAPRNLPDVDPYAYNALMRWYDTNEKFRKLESIKHSDLLERTNFLSSKYL